MLYSIQESGGTVYGFFPLPECEGGPDLTIEEWEERLREELRGILGNNGVSVSGWEIDGEQVDRVVIDIDPSGDEVPKIEKVHNAVGFVALTSEPGQ